MLSDEQITKYQTLYKNRYGKEISREEAYEQGAKLIRLIELIYKPMTEAEYQQLQERRRATSQPRISKTKIKL
jgi:urease accessory protein UreF